MTIDQKCDARAVIFYHNLGVPTTSLTHNDTCHIQTQVRAHQLAEQ